MTSDPSGFRDRLLDSQETTPGLREEYRRELDAILNHRLTPRSRILIWFWILITIAAAAMCVRTMIVHPDEWIVSATFSAVCIVMVAWLVRVLLQGGFPRRSWFAITERLGGTAVGAFVVAGPDAGGDTARR